MAIPVGPRVCAECGVAHGAYGARDRFGTWHDEPMIHGLNSASGAYLFGEDWDWRFVRVSVGRNAATGRLLCQRCAARFRKPRPARPLAGRNGQLPMGFAK